MVHVYKTVITRLLLSLESMNSKDDVEGYDSIPAAAKAVDEFIEKFKYLPAQRSEEWLKNRKFKIGGSEMGTIVGVNPYKKVRGLIENHLGITTFNGNINTYWGSILEDLVTLILEKRWHCNIRETGSLPGAINGQNYSPDGIVYLDFLKKTVLVEIKSPARRSPTGKVPIMYQPQVYTGLDTIPIADFAIFVDAMFRRCSITDFGFNNKYDKIIHPPKRLREPIALCMVGFYEKNYSGDYESYHPVKNKKDRKTKWFDIGACSKETLELVLENTLDGKLIYFMSDAIAQSDCEKMDAENINAKVKAFDDMCVANNYNPVAILPLKLFRMEIIPMYRDMWRYNAKLGGTAHIDDLIEELIKDDKDCAEGAGDDKDCDGGDDDKKIEYCLPTKNFVETHEETIDDIIKTIQRLDLLPREKQIDELDKLYPHFYTVSSSVEDELVNSLM